jgi:hypothetical protein
MTSVITKEIIEKIEALQNVMMASVTGGTSDNQSYRTLRDELFQTSVVKEALPRFVRTCGDLSQFWHFIKTKQTLPTYASRREFIWEAFRPLLVGADDETSAVERQAFFAKGSEHDAYVHIRSILQTANQQVFIIDPYMDSSIFQVLGTLSSAAVTVKLLTSKIPADFGLEAQKFVKQHSGFTIEARRTRDFHDRFIILDGKNCFLLGASIKDAGNKGFTVVPLSEISIVKSVIDHANQVWPSATPI